MKSAPLRWFCALALIMPAAVLVTPAQASNMTNHGGRVVHHPNVHVIYWHDDWDSVHSDPQFKRGNIDSWISSFVGSNYYDKAGQYDCHTGGFSESRGSLFGSPGGSTDAALIHLFVTGEIETPGTGVPYPCGDDDLYVVLLPKGTTIDNGFNKTCDSFGAYHLFAPVLVPPEVCGLLSLGGIQNSPYVIIPVDCATRVAGANGFYNDFDGLTLLLSHEMIEASTDPLDSFITSVPVIGDIFSFLSFVGIDPAWYDDTVGNLFTQSEAADKCEFSPFNPEVWLNDSIVAAYWSNSDGGPACGPGVVKTFTLAQSGIPGSVSVPVPFDNRTMNVNEGGGFKIQVATNTSHSYSFPTPVNTTPGTRYVTSEPPATIFVTDDFSKTAAYTTQYFLTVQTAPAAAATGNASLTPSDWYDKGPFTIHADQDVSAGAGSRYDFISWSNGITAPTPDFSFTLSGPITAQANYGLQRLVDFEQVGIPAGPTWHVTVEGTPHVGPYSQWYNDGSIVNYSYETPVPDTTIGTRYVLTGTAPPTGFAANAPTTVTGTYKTQHLLTISTDSIKANTTHFFNDGVPIGTATDLAPFSDWFDHGTSLVLTADPVVDGASGIQYFFQAFTPVPPGALDAPFTTVAVYKTVDQLVLDAIRTRQLYGPGAGGVATRLQQEWAAVQQSLAKKLYAPQALAQITVYINDLRAQKGKAPDPYLDPALSTKLQLSALMVYHNALCKAGVAGQISRAQQRIDYVYYSGLVVQFGGTPEPPCAPGLYL